MANQFHDGMLTGRKIFFRDVKKSGLIDKIKRIFKRLEAEIVEIYDGENIDMVIYDNEKTCSINSTERKRKHNGSLGFQPKRQRLDACIKNILLNNKIHESIENSNDNIKGSQSTLSQFLSQAKEKGSKIKSINEVWQWLSKYYKRLVEIDEPDDLIVFNADLDKYHRMKYLTLPAFKICDPFGDVQPLVLEKYSTEQLMWIELIDSQHEASFELRRKSTGTSRKMRKGVNETESGFCENCREYYQCLYQHLNTHKHVSFAENANNFQEIDKFIVQTPTVSEFFVLRHALWEKHKQSKISFYSLPSSMKQISIHEDSNNNIELPSSKVKNLEINSSSSSSSTDTDSTGSSCESSSESNSSSSDSKNNIEFNNNCMSSTPLNKIKKPNFFSPESISTEDQQQSQISSHVNEIIENLDYQLLKNSDDTCPQLSRLLCPNKSKNSPVLSRRFDWCRVCKRNHVPIEDIDNYQCKLSPINVENRINKPIKYAVDIDEIYKPRETDGELSSNINEPVMDKLNDFSENLVLCEEIIDLNIEVSKIDIDDNKTKSDQKDEIENIELKNELFEIGNNSKDFSFSNGSLINPVEPCMESENNNIDPNIKFNEISSAYILNNKIEVENKTHPTLDLSDSHESDKELSSSSSSANISLIQCSVNLERIDYQDEENIENVTTTSEIPELELCEEHQSINICPISQHSNLDSSDCISDQNYSGNYVNDDGNYQSSNPNICPTRKSRKGLILRGDLDPNSPISGKRKAAISAQRGIENSNRFFDTNIKKTIKTFQEAYEPDVYDPREILSKINYSLDSKSQSLKKVLREKNV